MWKHSVSLGGGRDDDDGGGNLHGLPLYERLGPCSLFCIAAAVSRTFTTTKLCVLLFSVMCGERELGIFSQACLGPLRLTLISLWSK